MPETEGEVLYNVKRVEVTEIDPATGLDKAGAQTIVPDAAEEADISLVYAEGEQKIFRTEDILLAISEEPDLLYGANITLSLKKLHYALLALMDGGTLKAKGYTPPAITEGNKSKRFKLVIYIANTGVDGEPEDYTKLTFSNCKGKLNTFPGKKDFYVAEFAIKARFNKKANLPPYDIDTVDALPADDTTAPVLTLVSVSPVAKPAAVVAKSNEVGYLYLVTAGANIADKSDLDAAIGIGLGTMASIVAVDTNTNIATDSIAAGAYKVYAVDIAGNVSEPQNITIS